MALFKGPQMLYATAAMLAFNAVFFLAQPQKALEAYDFAGLLSSGNGNAVGKFCFQLMGLMAASASAFLCAFARTATRSQLRISGISWTIWMFVHLWLAFQPDATELEGMNRQPNKIWAGISAVFAYLTFHASAGNTNTKEHADYHQKWKTGALLLVVNTIVAAVPFLFFQEGAMKVYFPNAGLDGTEQIAVDRIIDFVSIFLFQNILNVINLAESANKHQRKIMATQMLFHVAFCAYWATAGAKRFTAMGGDVMGPKFWTLFNALIAVALYMDWKPSLFGKKSADSKTSTRKTSRRKRRRSSKKKKN